MLVAPAGMTEEAKRDWLLVAWDTLRHIPPDILAIGARIARQTCDHPAKIVPAIIAATADMMRREREDKAERAAERKRLAAPKPNYVTAEEATKILKQFGLKPD